ncbi:LysE family translocator [Acinetobacter sp. WZC-1]|uniref:LysE family translocator n=1 Tax=Acinetobacter sp. WZC-1 TaxID=3459034 RepID=UPI00403DE833
MIESWLFIFAMFAVLLIPGPTNALLASAAHHQGILKTLRLIPAELLGYVYGISILALLIHLTMPAWPSLVHILHVASAVYVLWLAFHLWKSSDLEKHSQSHQRLNPQQLFLSTLKNPKVILFSAGIFPAETWDSFENYALVLGVFCLCLIPCSLLWMYAGRAVLTGGKRRKLSTDQLYKASAMLLMLCMLPVILQFF